MLFQEAEQIISLDAKMSLVEEKRHVKSLGWCKRHFKFTCCGRKITRGMQAQHHGTKQECHLQIHKTVLHDEKNTSRSHDDAAFRSLFAQLSLGFCHVAEALPPDEASLSSEVWTLATAAVAVRAAAGAAVTGCCG